MPILRSFAEADEVAGRLRSVSRYGCWIVTSARHSTTTVVLHHGYLFDARTNSVCVKQEPLFALQELGGDEHRVKGCFNFALVTLRKLYIDMTSWSDGEAGVLFPERYMTVLTAHSSVQQTFLRASTENGRDEVRSLLPVYLMFASRLACQ